MSLSASVSRLRWSSRRGWMRDSRRRRSGSRRRRASQSRCAAAGELSGLAARACARGLPDPADRPLFERFFDEAGGMQLVIHIAVGPVASSRLGTGLAQALLPLVNFPSWQAAANRGHHVLSADGDGASFRAGRVARYLHSNTVRAAAGAGVVPGAHVSGALGAGAPRSHSPCALPGRQKVAGTVARMAAEDLLSVVFPDQVACAENLPGELEIPDHPLGAPDDPRLSRKRRWIIEGLERLLRALESGASRQSARDLTEPSPLALEVLSPQTLRVSR